MISSVGMLSAVGGLNKIMGQMESSSKRLSSGSKSSVGSNAADLSIATGMASQLRSNRAASDNIQTGVNAQNIAAAGLSSQQESLQHLREMAVQGANGTNSLASSAALQTEANQVLAGMNQVANNTQFNGKNLLDGSQSAPGSMVIQAGSNPSDSVDISRNFANASPAGLGVAGIDLSTQAGSSAAITAIDSALDQVNAQLADIGASSQGLQSAASNLDATNENLAGAHSRLSDTDFAAEITQHKSLEYAAQVSVMMLKAQSKTSGSLMELLRSGP